MRFRLLLAACASFSGSVAYAQDSLYVGVGLGSFDYEEGFVDPILGRVADKTDTWKVFGGFEFNQYVTLEINYRKTGELMQSGSFTLEPVGVITDTLTADFTMTTLAAIGQLPMDWGVLLGGLGYYSSDNDFVEKFSADGFEDEFVGGTIRDDGLAAMLGIEWRFGRFGTRYGIRLEYEWWDIDAADASTIGISLSYGF